MTAKKVPLKLQSAYASYETSREALLAFRNQHPKLIEEYETLVSEYNSSYDQVKALYRDNVDTVGTAYNDFSARTSTSIDTKRLMELVSQDVADAIVVISYGVDRPSFNKAVSEGLITAAVAQEVTVEGKLAIYGPKKL